MGGCGLPPTPLHRIVLLVDRTTDRSFLEQQLQALWARIAHASVNHQLTSPGVHLLHAPASLSEAAQALLKSLFQAGNANDTR